MKNTRYLELDFYRTSYRSVKAHQYDKDTRFIEVTCVNDATVYPLDPTTMTCDLKLVTPDKRHMFIKETIQENGTVLITLEENMLLAAGVCKAELNIYDIDSHKILSTMPFDLIVISSVYDNSVIEGSNEFSVLNDMIFYNKELGDRLEQLESDVEGAESIREENEDVRIANEKSRGTEEKKRASNENEREKNEAARKDAEAKREDNEIIRLYDETARKSNELIRETNERSRQVNEIDRQDGESDRKSAETIRINQENEREDNESIRKQNEINRESAEDTREQNEIDRNTAEVERKDDFKSMQDINAEELERMKKAGSASEIASASYAADAKASKEAAKVSEENSKANKEATEASKIAAAESAESAAQDANNASDYATAAKSFAHGGTGTRDGEDQDNAEHYYEQVKEMAERLSNALIAKGTITFDELMAITDPQPGDQYNISDEFVTTNAFREGAGIIVPMGSNVYMTEDGYWDVLAGSPVASVNGETGNVEITPESIGAFPGVTVVRNINIDELYKSGLYYIVSCTALGESIPNGWIMVMKSATVDDFNIKQMYWQYNSNVNNNRNYSVFMRVLLATGWSDFVKFAMEDDVILKSSDAGQWVEDTSAVFAIEKLHNYWGLKINGTPNDWLRVPYSGLIPYAQSEDGYGGIGSKAWPFAEIHGKKLFGSVQVEEWDMQTHQSLESLPNGTYWVPGSQMATWAVLCGDTVVYSGVGDTGTFFVKLKRIENEQFVLAYNPNTGKMFKTSKYGLTVQWAEWTEITSSDVPVMIGATADTPGSAGLVPRPSTASKDKYLRGNGTWDIPANNMVEQSPTDVDGTFPVLFSNSASATATHTASVRKNSGLYYNPAKHIFVGENLRSATLATMASNALYMPFTRGTTFYKSSVSTGYLFIEFPEFTSSMTTFKVTIYNYTIGENGTSDTVEYTIGMYPYTNDHKLYGCNAHSVTRLSTSLHANLPVRFGVNGSTKPAIVIGAKDTKWSYVMVQVHDILMEATYPSVLYDNMRNSITISITTTPDFAEHALVSEPNVNSRGAIIQTGSEYNAIYLPDGTRNGFLEMPVSGILPHSRNNSDGTGNGLVGSSNWLWHGMYTEHMYASDAYIPGDLRFSSNGKAVIHAAYSSLLAIAVEGKSNDIVILQLAGFSDNTCALRPAIDGSATIGDSNKRFNTIYAKTGAIQTSDRNLKKDITELPDELTKKFILGLIACMYRMIDGESGRYHYGFIAQDVEALMEELGISSKDFAGFIKSPKTREVEVEFEVEVDEEYLDEETGEMKTHKVKKVEKRLEQEIIPGEYIYSLRYEEFIAPIVKVVQMLAKENEEQEKEIDALKEENRELKERMERIEKMLGVL